MIKDLSDVDQWHYVRTKSNPADYNYNSRGIDLTKLTKVKMWFEGSQFLWKPESTWQLYSGVLKVDAPIQKSRKKFWSMQLL